MAKHEKLIEEISAMTVLELNDFVKAMEEKFGVSAAMPVASAAPQASAAPAAEAVEEKSKFNVVLQDAGAKKIDVIKALKQAVPALSLGDAKQKVEGAPQTIAEGVNKDEAKKIRDTLEAAGAKVQLA